ncbi:MAG: hypothetical protein KDC66_20505 [Phaeodactylibacter sp.]|nr:hypothetical protein [Phaeodactylibacter sp.]
MEDSKLWQLTEKLSKPYLREATHWVHSPFFNRQEHLARLWAYLLGISRRASPRPEYESAFRASFPGEPYDAQKMRLAMSALYRLLLQFLAYKEQQDNQPLQLLQQAQALRRLGLEQQAQQQLQKAQQANDDSPFRDVEHFRLQYEMLEEAYHYSLRARPDSPAYLQELADNGDIALLAAKLRQACLTLAHRAVYPAHYQPGFIEEAIHYIEAKGLRSLPCIELYYFYYYTLKEPRDEQYFLKFRDLLIQESRHFPSREANTLYLLAINYCVRKVNDGFVQYFGEVMRLYQEGLKAGHLLENGQLSRFTYHNIVATGLRTGDFDWVERFIHEYRAKLERPYRESSFSFCLARLEFARQHYEQALPLLQKANYRDPLLNLAAKTLLIKIYYETEEFSLLQAHLEAMRNYIRRKKVIGYHRTNYLNITHYARKLMALAPFDKAGARKLAEAIRGEDVLTEKAWFLEQLPGPNPGGLNKPTEFG